MEPLTTTLVLTTVAGSAIPIGGFFARIERIQPAWLEQEFRHSVFAFGGGVLLSAVALVLVPEGIRHLSVTAASVSIIAGGVAFLLVDRALAKRGTPVSNLLAALLDFAPESIALGGLILSDPPIAVLLAFFIGLQNLPEGFNAYREMADRGSLQPARILLILCAAVLIGPVCGMLGLILLEEASAALGVTMLAASGGILYLVFQDIAPQARLERHWAPPLGAVLGFTLGLVAQMLL